MTTLPWRPEPAGENLVVHADNATFLPTLPDGSFTMIYVDPPFNTGRVQSRQQTTMVRNAGGDGDRTGFGGRSYDTIKGILHSYDDAFTDYWQFLEPRLMEAWRLLADDGTLYLHLDYREVHYAKVMLDSIFGRECFLNEIIWAYDYGARAKNRWPTKHDNILVYVKNPRAYHFDNAEVDREPYMAPGLVTAEKRELGKLPTDVWWHTIVSPTGKEKTGYPTQKPEGLLRRAVAASSREGDWVLDFFAGSGTLGAVAAKLGRRFMCVDQNPQAIAVMSQRLGQLAAFVEPVAGAPVFSRAAARDAVVAEATAVKKPVVKKAAGKAAAKIVKAPAVKKAAATKAAATASAPKAGKAATVPALSA